MHAVPAQDNDLFIFNQRRPNKISAKKCGPRAHRFEVAVDDVFTVQQAQTLDQRLGESLDQIEAEALVVIFLNQLVQVETETKHTRFDVNWPCLRAIRMQTS
jgi:hypothetical protein